MFTNLLQSDVHYMRSQILSILIDFTQTVVPFLDRFSKQLKHRKACIVQ